jgi:predicted ATPase
LPEDPRSQALEAELRTAVASAVIAINGYGDSAVETAYERARELYERLHESRQVGYTLAGLSLYYFNAGEVARGAELASEALALGEEVNDDALRVLASVQVAVPTFYQGAFATSLMHADAASRLYDNHAHRWLGYHYGADQGVAAHCFAALALMRLGRADTALWRVREAVEEARSLGDPFNMAYALFFEGAIHWNRGDHPAQEATASRLLALATEHQFQLFAGLGQLFQGAARALATGDKSALDDVYQGSQLAGATGFRGGLPAFVCLVAEAQRAAGMLTEAKGTAAAALATASDTGQPYWDAEIRRLSGEIRLELGDEAAGEAELQEALDCSLRQAALWPQLRAGCALAKLRTEQGRRAEARDLLAPICLQIKEGRSTPVVARATALLRTLSDSGAEASARQRTGS